jgi:putative NADPH-quinone reductase
MKILVIYAHPSHEGHCATILKEVEENLKSKGVPYELLDLYAIKYDPLLRECELYGRDIELAKDTKKHQQQIMDSDMIIFIYPVWWNTMPAILKGFIDRVFSAHFAFKYNPVIPKGMMPLFEPLFKLVYNRFDYGMPVGLLKGKKAVVFLTTGSPRLISYPWTGNRFKKIIKKDMLGFFGIKSRLYHISNCRVLNEWKVAEIKRKVRCALKRIR